MVSGSRSGDGIIMSVVNVIPKGWIVLYATVMSWCVLALAGFGVVEMLKVLYRLLG